MTDMHTGYIVTLERDVREDDAQAIITALTMVKGVVSVQPVVADITSLMAAERSRWEVRAKVFDALK